MLSIKERGEKKKKLTQMMHRLNLNGSDTWTPLELTVTEYDELVVNKFYPTTLSAYFELDCTSESSQTSSLISLFLFKQSSALAHALRTRGYDRYPWSVFAVAPFGCLSAEITSELQPCKAHSLSTRLPYKNYLSGGRL